MNFHRADIPGSPAPRWRNRALPRLPKPSVPHLLVSLTLQGKPLLWSLTPDISFVSELYKAENGLLGRGKLASSAQCYGECIRSSHIVCSCRHLLSLLYRFHCMNILQSIYPLYNLGLFFFSMGLLGTMLLWLLRCLAFREDSHICLRNITRNRTSGL